jgi:hypothetical protein
VTFAHCLSLSHHKQAKKKASTTPMAATGRSMIHEPIKGEGLKRIGVQSNRAHLLLLIKRSSVSHMTITIFNDNVQGIPVGGYNKNNRRSSRRD